jgi:hypothetical protein
MFGESSDLGAFAFDTHAVFLGGKERSLLVLDHAGELLDHCGQGLRFGPSIVLGCRSLP